jgi:glutathione synthase/RimK-type ligase-like ATP-grasp enzyme
MRKARVAILTVRDDLHAHVIRKALADRHGVDCVIVETDCLPGSRGLTWDSGDARPPVLPTDDGDLLDVRALEVIWWRRVNSPLRLPAETTDPTHVDLIANDTRMALLGLVANEFRGVWVNNPQATRYAENKLIQLRAAQRAGFRVPRTLVSQDPEQIRRFCAELDHRVIIKAVKGTTRSPVMTVMVSDALLAADASMRLSPAIYQECVPGTRHLRVCCFGDAVHAAQLEAEALDWRGDLNIPFRPTYLGPVVEARLRAVLADLGLRMGIFDFKLTDDGEPVWLEVNPQGQFLFVEGLTGLDLTGAFADFLRAEADGVARARPAGAHSAGSHPSGSAHQQPMATARA